MDSCYRSRPELKRDPSFSSTIPSLSSTAALPRLSPFSGASGPEQGHKAASIALRAQRRSQRCHDAMVPPTLPARQFAHSRVIDQVHERMKGGVVRQPPANMNDGTALQALPEHSSNERPGGRVNEVQHFVYENPRRFVDQRTNKRQSR